MTPIPYSIFRKAFTLLTGSKVQASEAILKRLDNCQWSVPTDQLTMVDVPNDMADLVRALGGPHGEAMLKAYVIRMEINNGSNTCAIPDHDVPLRGTEGEAPT